MTKTLRTKTAELGSRIAISARGLQQQPPSSPYDGSSKDGVASARVSLGDVPLAAVSLAAVSLACHLVHMAARNVLLLLWSCDALILLSPPGHHYSYYDSTRTAMYEFVRDFHASANGSANEALYAIGDEQNRKDLFFEYNVQDSVHGKLDDIWMRDLFVTQLSDTRLVRFAYRPAYLTERMIHPIDYTARALVSDIWPRGEVNQLDVVLDGGGIVWEPSTRRAVVTERVLRDNPWLVNRKSLSADGKPPSPRGLAAPYAGAPLISAADVNIARSKLEAILSAALVGAEASSGEVDGKDVTVAIIPEEAGAPRLGHVDGICNWLGPSTLALSDFSDPAIYDDYAARIFEAFGSAVSIVQFPYLPSKATWKDDFESADGIYVNFARTKEAVYVPTFGHAAADAKALELVAAHADRPPIAINASAVAIMGGSVRCLSTFLWGAPAEQFVASAAPSPPPADDTSGPLTTTIAIISGAAGILLILLLVVAYVVKARRKRKAGSAQAAKLEEESKRTEAP